MGGNWHLFYVETFSSWICHVYCIIVCYYSNKLTELSILKQLFLYHNFCWSEIQVRCGLSGLCLGFYKAKAKVSARLSSFLDYLGKSALPELLAEFCFLWLWDWSFLLTVSSVRPPVFLDMLLHLSLNLIGFWVLFLLCFSLLCPSAASLWLQPEKVIGI